MKLQRACCGTLRRTSSRGPMIHSLALCAALLLGSTATAATLKEGNQADPYAQGYDSAYRNDYGAAFSYWLPLALQGDARAQFNLGLMYHSGLFVEQDEAQALYWYHQAAANGIREAQEYLVVGYSEGWFGLDKDEAKARYWEQRLAENQ